jgi:hypothetical protein
MAEKIMAEFNLVLRANFCDVADQKTGPRAHCYVCGRHLTDPASISQGIGSECWQDVLSQIEEISGN